MAISGRVAVCLSDFVLCAACLLMSGCMLGGGEAQAPRIVGDKLYLPSGSFKSRIAKMQHAEPPVYTRFDQKYPPTWPDKLRFPEDTFILRPPLELRLVANEEMVALGYKSFAAALLIPLINDEAVEYLTKQAESAGYKTETGDSGSLKQYEISTRIPYPDKVVDVIIYDPDGQYRGLFKANYDHRMCGYTEVLMTIMDPSIKSEDINRDMNKLHPST
jgi:hypothetical protein